MGTNGFEDKARKVLLNKDVDGSVASNISRVTLPKASTSDLAALARKQATIAYDTTLNEVVIDSGSGFAAVGGGGSGANQSLSNLIGPTAINQDLIIATGVSSFVKTADDSSSDTLDLKVQSGNATGDDNVTGPLFLSSGDALGSGAGISGNTIISSGNADGTGATSGDVKISIGSAAGSEGTRGSIQLVDGSEGISGQVWTSKDDIGSGNWTTLITVKSQDAADGTVDSDGILIASGTSPGTSAPRHSGTINIASGDSGRQSGNINITSGSQSSSSGNSGNIVLSSGVANARSGDISIYTGSASNDRSGNISLTTGAITDQPRGHITLDALYLTLPTGDTDPSPGVMASVYFNTGTNKLRLYDGSSWVDLN